MILGNCRDEPSYTEDVINLIFKRDEELFIDNPHKKIYTKEGYEDIIYLLIELFNNVEIPKEDTYHKEDIYHIVQRIFNEFYNYHYDDEYKHHTKKALEKAKKEHRIKIDTETSPSKQIQRDIKKIETYKEFLLELYSDYINFNDGEIFLKSGIPKEAIEHLRAVEELKNKIITDGTIENKRYYKPKKPTKESIIELFHSIEKHYQIQFNKILLNNLLGQI